MVESPLVAGDAPAVITSGTSQTATRASQSLYQHGYTIIALPEPKAQILKRASQLARAFFALPPQQKSETTAIVPGVRCTLCL